MPRATLQRVLTDTVTPVLRPVTDSARSGGGEPPVSPPDAFAIGDWSIAPGSTLASVTISSLPNDNGSAITDVEYAVDGGAWVSSGGTGSFDITGLANGVEVSVQLRAVNAGGAGDASDTKNVTPEYEFVNAEAAAIVAAMTTPPTPEREELIDDTVGSLKSAGIWTKLDRLWIMAAHDAQAARLNWKSPAGTSLTPTNSPTFTTDVGYASDGSTSYLGTNFTPSTNGVQMTANSASMFGRPTGNVADLTASCTIAGTQGAASAGVARLLLLAADTTTMILNGGSGAAGATVVADKRKSFIVSRRAQADLESYIEGVSEAVETSSVARTLSTLPLALLALNNNGSVGGFCPSGLPLGAAGCGSGLSDTEALNLTTIINTYLAGL